MGLTPHNRDLYMLLRQIRAEMAQNRTDIQRLWKIAPRIQVHPYFVSHPDTSTAGP
jgi:hypothetical protein